MSVVASLSQLTRPWASLYADAPALQATTVFAHVGGLLLGGGFAIVADTATLRAAGRSAPRRRRQLAHIHGVHRFVLAGLALTFASGMLMLAADVETFAGSTVFWIKMGLVALLLVNGGVLTATESALRARLGDADRSWRRMRVVAVVSLALWFATLLAGTLLVNAGQ